MSKLTIGFGLVNVPLTMRLIREPKRSVSGRMLCPTHLQPITTAYRCGESCDHEHLLGRGEAVTGYARPDDPASFVVLDDGVLDEIAEERTGTASIERVCPVNEIDPIYFTKPYLLDPQKGGEQGFDLLATVLREDGNAAVANVVLSKSTVMLVICWSNELGALVGHVCEYADRIRWHDVEAVKSAAAKRPVPEAAYLDIARQLLGDLSGSFDAGEVEDTYTTGLVDAIAAAASGKPRTVVAKTASVAPAGDLMAALTASLQAAKPTPAAKQTTKREKVT